MNSLETDIKHTKYDIASLEDSEASFHPCSSQSHALLIQNTIRWSQRARLMWLKHGDFNTTFSTTMPVLEIITKTFLPSWVMMVLCILIIMTMQIILLIITLSFGLLQTIFLFLILSMPCLMISLT